MGQDERVLMSTTLALQPNSNERVAAIIAHAGTALAWFLAPLVVFLASSIALVCVSFIGAYGGQLLQRIVPLKWIRRGGGLIFLGLGIYTLVNLATSWS